MNPRRGQVQIGDSEHYLQFTTNALCTLEERMNMSLPEKINATINGQVSISVKDIRLFFWAGLLAQHKDISLEQAGEIMDLVDLATAEALIVDALNQAAPQGRGAVKNRTAPDTGPTNS